MNEINNLSSSSKVNQKVDKNLINAPQKYSVNPNAVDKTPKTDTVQISDKKDNTAKKVGIYGAIAAVAVTAIGLLLHKKLSKNGQKIVQEVAENATKKSESKVTQEVVQNVAKESESKVAQEVVQNIPKEAEGKVTQETIQNVAKETETKISQETVENTAKETTEKPIKETPEAWKARFEAERQARLMDACLTPELKTIKSKATAIEQQEFTLNGAKKQFEVWKGTQGGSNSGCFVQSKDSPYRVYYAKFGGNQSTSEKIAATLYDRAGINVPKLQEFQLSDGRTGILSEYIPNLRAINQPNPAVNEGFGMDALLANWDAVCSGNTMTDGSKVFKIDVGGALDYRARGGKKDFGAVVEELTTLLDPNINPQSARIYSTMTREDLIKSLEKVTNLDVYVSGSQYNTILRERKDYIADILEEVKATPQEDKSMLEYLKSMKQALVTKAQKAATERQLKFEKELDFSQSYVKEHMADLDKIFINEEGKFRHNYGSHSYQFISLDDLVQPYKGEVNTFYHGTNSAAKEQIMQHGFNQRIAPTHGYLDGVGGTYFALNPLSLEGYGSDVVTATFNGKIAEVNTNILNNIKQGHSFKIYNLLKSQGIATEADYSEAIAREYLKQKILSKGYQGIIGSGHSWQAGCQYFAALDPSLINIVK